MKLGFILALLLPLVGVAASSGNVSYVINLGMNDQITTTVPVSDLYSGSGSSATAKWKTLICPIQVSANGFNNCNDAEGGTQTYQVPSGNTFLVTSVCINSVAGSNGNFQWGYSDSAVTNSQTTAATNPWFSCGADKTYCMVTATTAGQPACYATSVLVPASKHVWVQSNLGSMTTFYITGKLL